MSEHGMRQRLVKALKKFDAVPIENRVGVGHPDINGIGFDIECKYLKKWPLSCDKKPVRFRHPLMKEQAIWLKRRWEKGGLTLLAVQVQREWFFFSGDTAEEYFEKLTRPKMREKAMMHFKDGLNESRLVQWIRAIS